MTRKPRRIVPRAISDALWKRDELEMQAVGKLLSAIKRHPPARTTRSRRTVKRGG